jgi:hypothetical protein
MVSPPLSGVFQHNKKFQRLACHPLLSGVFPPIKKIANAGLSTDDECLYLQFATQAIEDSNFQVCD